MAKGNNTIKRIERRETFTTVENNLIRNKELSFKAKGIMILMLSMGEGFTFHTNGLASFSTDGKDGVASGLKELEKHGYLERKTQHDENGKFAGIEYYIYEQPKTDLPKTEKPKTEKPSTENPSIKKEQPLRNNNTKKEQSYVPEVIDSQEEYEIETERMADELRTLFTKYYPNDNVGTRFPRKKVIERLNKARKKKSFDYMKIRTGTENYLFVNASAKKEFQYIKGFDSFIHNEMYNDYLTIQKPQMTVQQKTAVDWSNA